MTTLLTNRQETIIKTLCTAGNGLNVQPGIKAMVSNLSLKEFKILCELISNEFMMYGIKETFEPNNYGKELERLLDIINRQRLQN